MQEAGARIQGKSYRHFGIFPDGYRMIPSQNPYNAYSLNNLTVQRQPMGRLSCSSAAATAKIPNCLLDREGVEIIWCGSAGRASKF
jgi:hypothetical protein